MTKRHTIYITCCAFLLAVSVLLGGCEELGAFARGFTEAAADNPAAYGNSGYSGTSDYSSQSTYSNTGGSAGGSNVDKEDWCHACNSGSGVCDGCNGTGESSITGDECWDCDGSGICATCGGTGQDPY